MYSKTCAIEKPYSEAELIRLKNVFSELREVSKAKDAKAFVKRVETGLRA